MMMMMITQLSTVTFILLLQSESCLALSDYQLDALWKDFKRIYNKTYSADEDNYRRDVWAANIEEIGLHNLQADLGRYSYSLGINEFSDMTVGELQKYYLGARVPPDFSNVSDSAVYFKTDISDLPTSVDWRSQGYVTAIKNQGRCGSCWAFSSTGSLEGQNFKKTKQLISLSEQNLVDGTQTYGNRGCSGGWMMNAFRYVSKNGGIDTEASYPYQAKDMTCRFQSSGIGARCTGYVMVSPRGNEQALMAAVATIGPISVAIDANHASFFKYRSGVYVEPNCTSSIDHAVLVVGYGTYSGQDYWLVKNSWGTSWGMNGYVMMARNKNNQCAIASYAVYPTM